MYKTILCLLALIVAALAAPQGHEQYPVHIVRQESDINSNGYIFHFETSDGTARQEKGTLKDFEEGHRAIDVSGSYQYVGPDGLLYTVSYTADENGFKPQEHVSHPGQQ